MWVAAQEGRTAEVEALVEEVRAGDVRPQDGDSDVTVVTSKALVIAAINDHADTVVALLAAKAYRRPPMSRDALCACAAAGSVDSLHVLLAAGFSVNVPAHDGDSPLHSACFSGHADVAAILLDAGALLAAEDRNKHTPLFRAVCGGQCECVELLLASKASADDHCHEWSAVHVAAAGTVEPSWSPNYDTALLNPGSMRDVLRLLIAGKANVNLQTRLGQTPAYLAAFHGRPLAIQVLADAKADLDRLSNGRTPLHTACTYGYTDVVKALAHARADITLRDDGDATPLHVASTNGHAECVQVLVCAKVPLDEYAQGEGAVHVAAAGDYASVLQLLCAAKADIDLPALHDKPGMEGRTPAFYAAYHNSCDALRVLGDLKADLNRKATDGTFPLLGAVERGHIVAVHTLLAYGVQPDANADQDGWTPLMAAVCLNDSSMVSLLLSAKADAERTRTHVDPGQDPYRCAAIHYACSRGCTAALEAMVTARVDLGLTIGGDITPLFTASEHGHVECVRVLASAKVPLDDYVRGVGAVHVAASGDHGSVLRVLGAAKANLDLPALYRDDVGITEGTTPAHLAAGRNACVALQALGDLKADLNRTAAECPLLIAAEKQHAGAVQTLLDCGARPDSASADGRTALTIAACQNNGRMVRSLLCAKADATRQNGELGQSGRTAADLARSQGHLQVAAALEAWARGDADAAVLANLPKDCTDDAHEDEDEEEGYD
jgi:ankyrin repeat protein